MKLIKKIKTKQRFKEIFDEPSEKTPFKEVEPLSSRLKKLRNEKGMTVVEVANVIGVSRVSVGNWERGDKSPRIDHLKKYAKYFDISIDWLIYGDFEPFLYDVVFDGFMNKIELDTEGKIKPIKIDDYMKSVINWLYRNNISGFQTVTNKKFLNFDNINYLMILVDYMLFNKCSFGQIDEELYKELPNSVSNKYISYMRQFGYDSAKILEETTKMFNNDFKALNFKNIQTIEKVLNEYRKDVDDGTTQAILTLLNHNHRDEEN